MENKKQSQNKQGGPSRKSGYISVGMAVFAGLWTIMAYIENGAGLQPFLGVLFILLCMVHATYNFQGVRRQAAIDRGEISEKQEKKPEAGKKVAESTAKKTSRYAGYRVKTKPSIIVKRK